MDQVVQEPVGQKRRKFFAVAGWFYVTVATLAAVLESGWRSGYPLACLDHPILAQIAGTLALTVAPVALAALIAAPPKFVGRRSEVGRASFYFCAVLATLLVTGFVVTIQFFEFAIYCQR